MSNYYDGTKLLSLQDINGNKPEIYICTSNRSAGKTTYFGRYAVKRFLNYGEKFCLLYRYSYELDDVADAFFKDVGSLFYPGMNMRGEKRGRGVYVELFLDDISCGYAVCLNSADALKKRSHYLSDVKRIIFDEFQPESGKYCPNEITKFISIKTSISRGQGEQVRYCPVFMLSNKVSLLNPYYNLFDVASRIRADSKYIRGPGWVLENAYYSDVAERQANSGFMLAMAGSNAASYITENVYLNDNTAFIEKPCGDSRYLCTIKYKGNCYAMRDYSNAGVIYCDDSPDLSFPYRLAVGVEEHETNYILLRKADMFIDNMRWYFERGCFRFKNLACKDAVLKLLSYN